MQVIVALIQIEKYMFASKVSVSDGVASHEVCVVSRDCKYWQYLILTSY